MDLDPLRILVRVVFAYAFLLMLIRISGKHMVRQSSSLDFTLTIILGDMIDDAVWAEVHLSVFVVAALVLAGIHAALTVWRARQDSNLWPSAPEADALSS
jgi:uncharacterized membrane protein YcaP (DUF421 family)